MHEELHALLQVLSDICLEVPRGSFHMLVGPNGCGKSTLLKILGGLTRADRGMCHVLPPAGFVFQNPDHQVVMPTVGADVAFGLGRSAFQFSICVLLFLDAVSNYAMLCSFFMLQVLSGVIFSVPCGILTAY